MSSESTNLVTKRTETMLGASVDVPNLLASIERKGKAEHQNPGQHERIDQSGKPFDDLTAVDLGTDGDIPLGGVVLSSDKDRAWIDTGEGHTVVIGSTGSQKTRRVVMPSIWAMAMAGESMVIADCKGEIMAETESLLREKGYTVFNLNLRSPYKSSGWNPLIIPYRLYRSNDPIEKDKAQDMVYDLASILSPIGKDNDFWDGAGQDVVAGCMFLLFEYCDSEEMINMLSLQILVSEVERGSNDICDALDECDKSSPVYGCLSGTVFNADVTRRGSVGVSMRNLRPFTSHTSIMNLLSCNDLELSSIDDEKIAFFLTVPDDRTIYHSLVSLFIRQAYSSLLEKAANLPGLHLNNRVNFVIDEFGTFPRIPSIGSMITASRSRRIRFLLVTQSKTQIISKYGADDGEVIFGNCDNIVYINSREIGLLRAISELAGDDEDGRPIATVSELQRLDKESGEMLVFHGRGLSRRVTSVDISEYRLPKTECSEGEFRSRDVKAFDLGSALLRRMRAGSTQNGPGKACSEPSGHGVSGEIEYGDLDVDEDGPAWMSDGLHDPDRGSESECRFPGLLWLCGLKIKLRLWSIRRRLRGICHIPRNY